MLRFLFLIATRQCFISIGRKRKARKRERERALAFSIEGHHRDIAHDSPLDVAEGGVERAKPFFSSTASSRARESSSALSFASRKWQTRKRDRELPTVLGRRGIGRVKVREAKGGGEDARRSKERDWVEEEVEGGEAEKRKSCESGRSPKTQRFF